jgi:hypothetical protein
MRKIFATCTFALVLMTGACAEVDSGEIVDKVRQGSQYPERGDVCRFQLDDGTEKGWLQVDCAEFQKYEVGEQYPR